MLRRTLHGPGASITALATVLGVSLVAFFALFVPAAPPAEAGADGDAQDLVSELREQYPGYNVMVIQQETYGEPQNIVGVVENYQTGFGTNTWDVWVFESGTFTNDGDLGYNNWVFAGIFERSGDDGETVTFEPIG